MTPRGADVAVLSHAFWRSEFGGRDVRGELLQVGNVRATIIGVAPEGFNGVNDANPPAVYIPITTFAGSTGTTDRDLLHPVPMGLDARPGSAKPGVTVEQAEADATQRSAELGGRALPTTRRSPPLKPRGRASSVSSVQARRRARSRPRGAHRALGRPSSPSIVLLIACANVANLSLARAHAASARDRGPPCARRQPAVA